MARKGEGLVVRHPGRGTLVVEDIADAPIIDEMAQLLREVERLVPWYRGDHYHHHVHLTRKAR